MSITIQRASWPAHKEQLYLIRRKVFIEEQQVPEEIEIDEWDEKSIHVLALEGQQPVGCGRLLPDGHIGRMAVLPSHRGQGIGAKLLQTLIDLAQQSDMKEVILSSQVHAIDFYLKAGFTPYGDVYQEAGIPHRAMKRNLQ
ncbi:MAG TPA: GNAT family N-acetyltransferase [Myxococcales bacterium]|nr:GNAT family N-acetyltransferase [Deltaproteobacteria bacterium]MBU48474.1 GNAT family N-acetyltransferase [Deltaproteobacteria bacterium]HAA58402.1 GNAT family N-acetyltransferase [Myxococcales bacterium]|tara:strand:+ start:12584 stop:13006 length:423 start_codon:yes stop_codon:yes gene_type:complete